eukprot:g18931.t1
MASRADEPGGKRSPKGVGDALGTESDQEFFSSKHQDNSNSADKGRTDDTDYTDHKGRTDDKRGNGHSAQQEKAEDGGNGEGKNRESDDEEGGAQSEGEHSTSSSEGSASSNSAGELEEGDINNDSQSRPQDGSGAGNGAPKKLVVLTEAPKAAGAATTRTGQKASTTLFLGGLAQHTAPETVEKLFLDNAIKVSHVHIPFNHGKQAPFQFAFVLTNYLQCACAAVRGANAGNHGRTSRGRETNAEAESPRWSSGARAERQAGSLAGSFSQAEVTVRGRQKAVGTGRAPQDVVAPLGHAPKEGIVPPQEEPQGRGKESCPQEK